MGYMFTPSQVSKLGTRMTELEDRENSLYQEISLRDEVLAVSKEMMMVDRKFTFIEAEMARLLTSSRETTIEKNEVSAHGVCLAVGSLCSWWKRLNSSL